MGSTNWLERYRSGEREQVWWELRQLGAAVRAPEVVSEALAVCDEMAVRARSNVETIVDRLTAQGFSFHSNDDERSSVVPFRSPSSTVPKTITVLEENWGPIPMVVSSWMRLVGDVWLVGTHPEWPESDQADPLVIELEGSRYPGVSIVDFWAGEYDAWQEMSEGEPEIGGFVMPVAPDRLHKANISGGSPYGFRLPDSCADGVFVAESSPSFVSYLNDVFSNGGFPARTGGANEAKLKRSLSEGLLGL